MTKESGNTALFQHLSVDPSNEKPTRREYYDEVAIQYVIRQKQNSAYVEFIIICIWTFSLVVNSFKVFFFFYNLKSKHEYATMPRVLVGNKLFHFAVSSFIIFLVKKYLISSLQYLKGLLLSCDDPRSPIVVNSWILRPSINICDF